MSPTVDAHTPCAESHPCQANGWQRLNSCLIQRVYLIDRERSPAYEHLTMTQAEPSPDATSVASHVEFRPHLAATFASSPC